MPTLIPPEKPDIGHGILAPDYGAHIDAVSNVLLAAYDRLAEDRSGNFVLWREARGLVQRAIQDEFDRHGLTGPPLVMDSFWARVVPPALFADPVSHLNLVRALLTNYTTRVSDHIRYRLNNAGNVHFEFTGPTGLGKSSAAIHVADWMNPEAPIRPDNLEGHLSFDLPDLSKKLRIRQPGEVVIQDEYLEQTGEGSRTVQALVTNLEDTLRASQVSLFLLSPRVHEHGTMQARLEAIAENREEGFVLFLVWVGENPHGVIAIPWCRKELYEVYAPWKKANTERARAGQFKDQNYIPRTAMRLYEDTRVISFLTAGEGTPRKKDFEAAVAYFGSESVSMAQATRIADFMQTAAYGYEEWKTRMTEWFNVEPNDGLQKVAKRCHAK